MLRVNKDIDFGDYVRIEMFNNVRKVYYVFKVIGSHYSNVYKDIPLRYDSKELKHQCVEPLLSVVQYGPVEREAFNVRVSDCEKFYTIEQCEREGFKKFQEAVRKVLTSDKTKEIEDFMDRYNV